MIYVAEAARRAGVNPSTVRYYERRGLLPRAARTMAGYRVLDGEAVERLRFIRRAQALGLRLTEIREILRLRDHGEAPCKRVRELAMARLRSIDEKIADLKQFRRSLTRLLSTASADSVDAGHICPLIGDRLRSKKSGSRRPCLTADHEPVFPPPSDRRRYAGMLPANRRDCITAGAGRLERTG